MYVNLEGLSNSEIEFLKATQYADNALNCLNTIKMPNNFQFEAEIKKIIIDVNNLRDKAERIKKVIASKREEFIVVENKNRSLIDNLANGINIGLDTSTSTSVGEDVGLADIVADTNIKNTNNGHVQDNVELANNTADTNIQETTSGYAEEIINSTNNVFNINIDDTTSGNAGTSNVAVAQGINNILQFELGQKDKYSELHNALIDVYKIKNIDETSKILSLMSNNVQIKDYAIGVEKIINGFSNRVDEFSKQFGFSFYKKNENGENIPNVELIYADIFINVNSDLLTKDTDGNNIVNPTFIENEINNEIKLKSNYSIKSNSTGVIDVYIRSKGIE